MNVLCHGVPFCCDWPLLRAYTGEHVIRVLGTDGPCDYVYDPATEDGPSVVSRISREWPVDLLMCWTPEIYPPPLRIEEVAVRTAACISDWNIYFDVLLDNLRRFDVVLSDRGGVEAFGRKGLRTHYVTPLYSHVPGIHEPSRMERRWDVVFAGNLDPFSHGRRNGFLARLAAMDARFAISIRTGLDPAAYGAFLASSRTVFNHSIRGELNLRVFEAAACGSCPLLEADNAEVTDCFTPDRDVVLYRDDGFEAELTALLDDGTRVRNMAAAAQQRSSDVSGAVRMDQVIRFCAETETNHRGFCALSPYAQAAATYRLYSLGGSAAYLNRALEALATLERIESDGPETHTIRGLACLHPLREGSRTADARERAARAFYDAHRGDRESVVYGLNAAFLFHHLGRPSMEQRCLEAALRGSTTNGAAYLAGGRSHSTVTRWRRASAEGRGDIGILHSEAAFGLGVLALERTEYPAAQAWADACAALDDSHAEWPLLKMRGAVGMGDGKVALDAAAAGVVRLPLHRALRDGWVDMLHRNGYSVDGDRESKKAALMGQRIVTP